MIISMDIEKASDRNPAPTHDETSQQTRKRRELH